MSILKKYILSAVVLSLIVFTFSYEVQAKTSTEAKQEKEELEEELNNANQESKDLEEGLEETKQAIDSLNNKKNSVEDYIKKLDKELSNMESSLAETLADIDLKQEEINLAKQELQKAKEVEKNQYESMKKRIQYMYENRLDGYFQMLITSGSFSEMLSRVEYISSMSVYDRNMLAEYQKAKELVIQKEEELNREYTQLAELKDEQEDKQTELAGMIDTKSSEISKYEKDIASAEQLAIEYEEDLAAQSAVISALEASVAAKKAEIAKLQKEEQAASTTENIQLTYDGGTFTWPCPASHTISSEYGNRLHPILQVNKFHSGIDIAAPTGSAIVAAYDGTVVASAYNASMGNYVMIDHGDGLYTVYMHASALYVSADEKVTKGQNIAAVGSTGRSTGPHLHFGVRLNGSYVNPHNYVG